MQAHLSEHDAPVVFRKVLLAVEEGGQGRYRSAPSKDQTTVFALIVLKSSSRGLTTISYSSFALCQAVGTISGGVSPGKVDLLSLSSFAL